jgi:chromosome transmission fidelity protein 4
MRASELTVKLVNIEDMTKVKYLREQGKGTKHITFDPNGRYATVSCTDGVVYLYSMDTEEPELARKLDGVIRRLEPEDEATSRVVWHPDGTAFATADASRDIALFSVGEWKKELSFSGGHNGDITAMSWSPNGALMVTAAKDGQVLLWESKTQKILHRYNFPNVINLAWHPTKNGVSLTTSDGEIFIFDGFVPKDHQALLQKPLQAAPIFPGALTEISDNVRRPLASRPKEALRRGSIDSLDDILGYDQDMEDFVEDDDGAGYVESMNEFGKRTNEHLGYIEGHMDKRTLTSFPKPKVHPPLQPGSTPWRGNRRYLCKSTVL